MGRKLLVVDDEAKIREIIKKYAALDGAEVTEAADGLDALAQQSRARMEEMKK